MKGNLCSTKGWQQCVVSTKRKDLRGNLYVESFSDFTFVSSEQCRIEFHSLFKKNAYYDKKNCMLWTLIVMLFLIFKKKIVNDLLFELVALKFLLKFRRKKLKI